MVSQVDEVVSVRLADDYAGLDRIKGTNLRYVIRQYYEAKGDLAEARRRQAREPALMPSARMVEAAVESGKRGDVDGSIVELKKAIRLDPSYDHAWTSLAVSYSLQEQYDSALAVLEISLGLNPYNAATHDNLAKVYYRTGETEQAEKHWRRAFELAPHDYEPVRMLMSLLAQQRRFEAQNELLRPLVGRNDLPPDIALAALDRGLGAWTELNADSLRSLLMEDTL